MMRMRAARSASSSRRATSRPSSRGIRRSSSRTSGRSAAYAESAFSPSPNSAMTSMTPESSSTAFMPWRKIAWSSTRTTRSRLVVGSFMAIVPHGQYYLDPGAPRRARFDDKVASAPLGTLAHGAQSATLAGAVDHVVGDSLAVVLDAHPQPAGLFVDPNRQQARTRVLECVWRRLRDDAVQRILRRRRDVGHAGAVHEDELRASRNRQAAD